MPITLDWDFWGCGSVGRAAAYHAGSPRVSPQHHLKLDVVG